MTRLVLCAGLSGATLLVGILTAIVQSHNRELGVQLDEVREEISLVEAVNAASRARIIALDHGPLPADHQLGEAPGTKGQKPDKNERLVSR